jgi:hypothetical protein
VLNCVFPQALQDYGLAGQSMKRFCYVYIPHTAKFRPWKVETAVAFSSETKARAFEKYLKSGSGREFSRRHF